MDRSWLSEPRRLVRRLFRLTVKREVIYLYEELCERKSNVDILYIRNLPNPIAGANFTTVKTMKIDLRNDIETLWNNLSKTSRYEISRAQREGVTCKTILEPSLDETQQLLLASDELTLRKDIGAVDHELFRDLQLKKQLYITTACDDTGKVLSRHAYVKIRTSVVQLANISMIDHNKASDERRAAARANKYLHWQDFCSLKKQGVESCDLGGGATGEDENGPNSAPLFEFKRRLGARAVETYHVIVPKTPLGHLVVKAFSLRA